MWYIKEEEKTLIMPLILVSYVCQSTAHNSLTLFKNSFNWKIQNPFDFILGDDNPDCLYYTWNPELLPSLGKTEVLVLLQRISYLSTTQRRD